MSLDSDIVDFVVLIRVMKHVLRDLSIVALTCLVYRCCRWYPSSRVSDSCIEIRRRLAHGPCSETAPRRPTAVLPRALHSTSV